MRTSRYVTKIIYLVNNEYSIEESIDNFIDHLIKEIPSIFRSNRINKLLEDYVKSE